VVDEKAGGNETGRALVDRIGNRLSQWNELYVLGPETTEKVFCDLGKERYVVHEDDATYFTAKPLFCFFVVVFELSD
jgi:hypothetical protein